MTGQPILFVTKKQQAAGTAQVLPAVFREIERWGASLTAGGGITDITSVDGSVTVTNPTGPTVDLHVAAGGGGGYLSLTGPGQTATPGDLTQAGGFTVNDTAAHGINLHSVNTSVTLNSGTGTSITHTGVTAPGDSTHITVGDGIVDIFADTLGSVSLTSNFTLNIGSDFTGTQVCNMVIGQTNDTLGFFAATGVSKRTVTGSRAGNAALASLLTALGAYGFITNSSTP